MVYSKKANILSIFIIQFNYNAHSDWFKRHSLFQKSKHLIYFYKTVQMQRALWLVEKARFIPKRRTFELFLYNSSDTTRTLVGWKTMVYSKKANIWSVYIIQFRYHAHFGWMKNHGLFQKGEHFVYFNNTVQIQRAFWLVEKAWFIPKRRTFDLFL